MNSRKIQTALIIIIILLFNFRLCAQNFENLKLGTDSTFEIMTWNIEWFPKNGPVTVDNVTQIINALDVDIIALQEIGDKQYFSMMMDSLIGYEAYYVDDEYSGLAYIYKPDEVIISHIYEIYTDNWREFPRAPSVMEMSFMNERLIIINNHLKCCGDEILDLTNAWDEEKRRYDAINLIRQYIVTVFPDEKVIVLGDLNDEITDDTGNNVFKLFLNDTSNFMFADMDIASGSGSDWSYPSWPSHIDHVIISNELFNEFVNEGSDIQTIKIDEHLLGGFNQYFSNISDHRPVALKLKLEPDSNNSVHEIHKSSDLSLNSYPNPLKHSTTFSFLPAQDKTEIEIFNIKGQKIHCIHVQSGQTNTVWSVKGQKEGVYYAKLIVDNKLESVRKLILIK